MDMLAGYGSGSDDDSDTPKAVKTDPVAQAQQPEHIAKQQQKQQQPNAQPAGAQQPGAPKVQLPPPYLLFGDAPPRSDPAAAAKRPFTSVTGHSLPNASSKPKASKEHAAARPGAAAKPAGNSMLVPPQLCGRSNVVTEDLDKMFSKKTSPAARQSPQQQ